MPVEVDRVALGKRLKSFADTVGGVGKLAELLGITQPNLSGSYISGKSVPGGELIARLMELGCDVQWLLTGSQSSITVSKNKIGNISDSVHNIGSGNQITNLAGSEKLQQRIDYLMDKLMQTEAELAKCKEQLKHGSSSEINTGEGQ